MKAEIFVRFSFEGFHYWKDATEHRDYLKNRHRHIFYVELRCPVVHDDREIEFHDLIDEGKQFFKDGEMNNMSCEMMARKLSEDLSSKYYRTFTASVSEDNECGATITKEYNVY